MTGNVNNNSPVQRTTTVRTAPVSPPPPPPPPPPPAPGARTPGDVNGTTVPSGTPPTGGFDFAKPIEQMNMTELKAKAQEIQQAHKAMQDATQEMQAIKNELAADPMKALSDPAFQAKALAAEKKLNEAVTQFQAMAPQIDQVNARFEALSAQ